MAICKNCVHYDICGNKKCNFMTEETTRKGLNFPCSDYKDISRFVEVVRCKDCKFLTFSDFYGECSNGHMCIVSPDDFCSRGIRKDGANID